MTHRYFGLLFLVVLICKKGNCESSLDYIHPLDEDAADITSLRQAPSDSELEGCPFSSVIRKELVMNCLFEYNFNFTLAENPEVQKLQTFQPPFVVSLIGENLTCIDKPNIYATHFHMRNSNGLKVNSRGMNMSFIFNRRPFGNWFTSENFNTQKEVKVKQLQRPFYANSSNIYDPKYQHICHSLLCTRIVKNCCFNFLRFYDSRTKKSSSRCILNLETSRLVTCGHQIILMRNDTHISENATLAMSGVFNGKPFYESVGIRKYQTTVRLFDPKQAQMMSESSVTVKFNYTNEANVSFLCQVAMHLAG